MNHMFKILPILLTVLCSSTGQKALAQNPPNKLNALIRNESSAIKAVEQDFSPGEAQSIRSEASRLGGSSLVKQMGQVGGNSNFSGCNLSQEISTMSKQLSHIPVISQIMSALSGSVNSIGNQNSQFHKPTVVSKLLRSEGAAGLSSPGVSSILGEIDSMQGLGGLNSAAQNPACQSELNQAATVLPAAVTNLEQENQEVKQLLSE